MYSSNHLPTITVTATTPTTSTPTAVGLDEPVPVRRNTLLHLRTVEELNLNTETINKESESRLSTLHLRSEEHQQQNATNEHRQRSTLHLRTVDELNLMNLNEVQNLIENFQEEPTVPTQLVSAIQSSTTMSATNSNLFGDNTDNQHDHKTKADLFADVDNSFQNVQHNHQLDAAARSLDSVLQDLQDVDDNRYTISEDLDKYAYTNTLQPQHSDNMNPTSSYVATAATADICQSMIPLDRPNVDVAIIESTSSSMDEKTTQQAMSISTTNTQACASHQQPQHSASAIANWNGAHWNSDNASDNHQQAFVLSTPTLTTIANDLADESSVINLSDNTILEYARDLDENMLFVCAQEIIGTEDENQMEIAEMAEMASHRVHLAEIPPRSAIAEDVVTDSTEPCSVEEDVPRKGRIYVVNNLMKTNEDVSEIQTVGTLAPIAESNTSVIPSQNAIPSSDETNCKKTRKSRTKPARKKPALRPKGRRKIGMISALLVKPLLVVYEYVSIISSERNVKIFKYQTINDICFRNAN